MRFIDLFAGLGGFHIALRKLGHKCVFASEIKEELARLYERNFEIKVFRDIRKIRINDIPKHDILCAGFPCTPFSKAGKQEGLKDEKNGNLFDIIFKILKYHQPNYFILENVPHLKKHDNEKTWSYIEKRLKKFYEIDERVFSPHEFNIPHHRYRIFIVGSKKGLQHFKWPNNKIDLTTSIHSILDNNSNGYKKVEKDELNALNIWQEFINTISSSMKIPKFPIWAMEFGATYPFEDITPFYLSRDKLSEYKGKFGVPLKDKIKLDQLKLLPSYASLEQKRFPSWKIRYIKNNRDFYNKNEKLLKNVVQKIKNIKVNSWQKLEWNIQEDSRNIFNHLIQFRPSGIRIMETKFSPSLVTTPTQVPIIGWEKRYISKGEGAKLQSMNGIKLPEDDNVCFRALGNAVNTKIVTLIVKSLLNNQK